MTQIRKFVWIAIILIILTTVCGCGEFEYKAEELNLFSAHEEIERVPEYAALSEVAVNASVEELVKYGEPVVDYGAEFDLVFATDKYDKEQEAIALAKKKAEEEKKKSAEKKSVAQLNRESFHWEKNEGLPYGYSNYGMNELPVGVQGWVSACKLAFPSAAERNYHDEYICELVKQQKAETAQRRAEIENAREYICPFCKYNAGSINSGGGEAVLTQHLNDNHYGRVCWMQRGFSGYEHYYRRTWLGSWVEEEITYEQFINKQ